MITRPATSADLPFLRLLHHRAYREVVERQFGAWDEAAQDLWFEQGLATATFRIVERDGAAVGAIALSETPGAIELVELQVLPEFQGQGWGTALLSELIQLSQATQRPLHSRVLRENRARHLYERNGFVITSETATHVLMQR
jgi:ribosomal protein S18 acetylase RimI-like enzyme